MKPQTPEAYRYMDEEEELSVPVRVLLFMVIALIFPLIKVRELFASLKIFSNNQN